MQEDGEKDAGIDNITLRRKETQVIEILRWNQNLFSSELHLIDKEIYNEDEKMTKKGVEQSLIFFINLTIA
jgi:hypothetical protein